MSFLCTSNYIGHLRRMVIQDRYTDITKKKGDQKYIKTYLF